MDKKIIYVYSTKGGVGKSTISINLAFYLKKIHKKVTLLDMDFAGPSIPLLLEKNYKNKLKMKNFYIIPFKKNGLNISSIGFIKSPNEISFLTGKYLEGAINQFLNEELFKISDIIIVDMPPGFGEFHRYLFTNYPGKVILITIPHFLSKENLKRGLTLLKHINIPILEIIENMAYFECLNCKKKHQIFGENITKKEFPFKIIQIPFNINLEKSVLSKQKMFSKNIDNIFKEIASDIINEVQ
ncbi:MAG: P-loop NTPase [Candidatus Nanoarchaeia archaeon]|nr:P-loop NTPase [Candidatus Nanoarchaeia archaeon]